MDKGRKSSASLLCFHCCDKILWHRVTEERENLFYLPFLGHAPPQQGGQSCGNWKQLFTSFPQLRAEREMNSCVCALLFSLSSLSTVQDSNPRERHWPLRAGSSPISKLDQNIALHPCSPSWSTQFLIETLLILFHLGSSWQSEPLPLVNFGWISMSFISGNLAERMWNQEVEDKWTQSPLGKP